MTDPALAFKDEQGRGRYYRRPSTQAAVPSITNIMKQQNKPAINGSMVKKAAEYAVENRDRLAALTPAEQITLIKGSQYIKSEASRIGDVVHDWVDRFVKGQPPSHEEVKAAGQTEQWMFDRFRRFNEYYKPQYTASEFTVWSDRYGYAGSGDLSFNIGGKHVLADTKTGTGIYPETAMQLAALANADIVLYPDGREEPLPKFDAYAILHIRPRSYTLAPVYKIEEAFETFLALKRVFDWTYGHANETIGYAPKQIT